LPDLPRNDGMMARVRSFTDMTPPVPKAHAFRLVRQGCAPSREGGNRNRTLLKLIYFWPDHPQHYRFISANWAYCDAK
jgi:hypothetical protein